MQTNKFIAGALFLGVFASNVKASFKKELIQTISKMKIASCSPNFQVPFLRNGNVKTHRKERVPFLVSIPSKADFIWLILVWDH